MPIRDYGVWKAKPVSYTYETARKDPHSPHIHLKFSDGNVNEAVAAINIKSGDHEDSRLVYWVVPALSHPIVRKLQALGDGFHSLQGGSEEQLDNLRLDYIRGNLFQKQTGRLLPHDIPGENNDILDVLKPILTEAISHGATIYLYGSHFDNGEGIHNVHMNQGSPGHFKKDNGVYQDGGFFLQFRDHWKGIFLGFASQAVHTDDDTGNPVQQNNYQTWADFLDPEVPAERRAINDMTDTPVLITRALVNPLGPDNKQATVFLTNRTAQPVDLTGWKIRNQDGQFEELPSSGATLAAKQVAKEFSVPKCPLSDQGGLITLLNAQGYKVHGVSYAKVQPRREGNAISFEQINGLNSASYV
ncbi:hypothetical protein TGAM01_v204216 [Trichoderma gamsii]|uniref:LTD domain-containing protein n=1 Tax=Trichoderma gamsii TaxID=398673 RepID=A0A2P4ZQZ1_9HYPO|nr:hypothetical protein TGAM01_v204216 [Trichoderma gamsii]PON26715.1 hypothetical protein TGAM01_v204216 [Trichoderma gamsii]